MLAYAPAVEPVVMVIAAPAPQPAPPHGSHGDTWILLGILAAALALRLIGLGGDPLWLDEAATWRFASMPVAELLGPVGRAETNPPLYYLLQRGWVALAGDGEVALRLPSVLFGLLAIPLTYLAGRWLIGRPVGLLAAAHLALMLGPVRHSQEARGYALMLFAASLAIAGFARLLHHPTPHPDAPAHPDAPRPAGRPLAWAMYAIGAGLALYAHNTAVLLPATLTLAIAAIHALDRRRLGPGFARRWVAVNAGVFALWLPWAWVVLEQFHALGDFWIARPGPRELIGMPLSLYAGADHLLRPALAGALAVAGLAFAVDAVRHRRWAPLIALSAVALGAILAAFALSQFRSIFIARVLLWTTPAGAIFVAAGVFALRRPWARVGLATAILALTAAALAPYYQAPPPEPWDQLTDRLRRADPDAAHVLLYPYDAGDPLAYYARHDPTPPTALGLIPADAVPIPRATDSNLARRVVPLDELPAALATGPARLLLVIRRNHPGWPPDPPLGPLAPRYSLRVLYDHPNLALLEATPLADRP